MRIGFGYDSHRFVHGRRLILGGVEIPYEEGLLGHSDADALVHAVCDAILGALSEGDIGKHFPDTDPTYRGISSLRLLSDVGTLAARKGCSVNNVDSTVVIERPKLQGYIHEMSSNIAGSLNITQESVNIKATTNEGMGFVGRNEGVAAFAVVTLWEKED
ncbi:MAG: 2-C-methyl-D-erythritol 2,4-cyclodiphosphate synthase [Syntrophales bacterium]